MKIVYGLAFAAFAAGGAQLSAQDVPDASGRALSVADFGAVPDDGQNDAAALRKAMDFARGHPGTTLRFAPGTYNFRDEAAVALMDKAMTGGLGGNTEVVIFTPYYPYAKGLDLENVSGLTIEAKGAELLFEGWGEPVSLVGARDIAIKGLTIDYKRRAWSGGTIAAVSDGFYDVDMEADSPVDARVPVPRINFWDKAAHRHLGEGNADTIEVLGPLKIRIRTSRALPKGAGVGTAIALAHSMHFRPAILIQESDNVRLDGVTIHSQPGMGIVAHRCSNVTFSGLRIVPAPGAYFSTTTDATHLTSCSGLIRYENSVFESQGDDAINIHNYYWPVKRTGKRGQYVLSPSKYMHASVLDHPDVGARLEVVRAATLELVGTVTVKSVVPHRDKWTVDVELEGDLPADLDNYVLSDVSRLPKVEIVGNMFLSHRSRGALIKSRNVLIERNLFRDNTGTAIHVAAEGGWREGVASSNVVIRENHFIGNGYGGGTVHGTSAIAVNIDAKAPSTTPLHHGLTIESNIIDGGGAQRCIWVSQAEGVAIRFNQVSGCKVPIVTESSANVTVEGNRIAEGS